MIKPNWDIFKAKFSENPQHNFEWFCYLLFCNEFNRPQGIFRFKNQHALETNLIEIGTDAIGWQAKFYDTPLSSHKNELLKTIENAKNKYPKITKLYLYTNKEWGQLRNGKDPSALIETNKKAIDLGIELIWKMTSYFESEFVSIKNQIISKHFFSLDKSLFNVILEQQRHSENILNQIQTCITFNSHNIEIDRNKSLIQLKDESQKTFIISGVGGSGKTVLIKKLYEQLKEEIPFYVFKASEFELRNINDLFTGYSFYDFSLAHKDEKNKYIVIDSAENLLDLKNIDPFKEFLSTIVNDEWQVIFTTRDGYVDDLNYQLFETYNIAPVNIRVDNLDMEELNRLSNQYHFSLPQDFKLLELIKIPFYLNEYLKFHKDGADLKYSEFKNVLWNKNIKKSQPKREQCFLQIALERANSGQFFISPSCESDILDKELLKDGILGYETAGYFITHDIYEEWALEKSIEIKFMKNATSLEFFAQIGSSLPIRRSFRSWLSEKLLLNDKRIKAFIEEIITTEKVEPFWKDELLVSILRSNYSKTFFDMFKNELLADDSGLLKKLTFIVRVACKEVDDSLFKQLGIKNLNLFSLEYTLTKPKGQGWESLIQFVFENIEEIGIKNINFILPVIHDWNNKVKTGETTRFSSLIALQFYQWIIKDDAYYPRDNTKGNIFQTILYGASEIKDELKEIFDQILKNKWKNHRDPYCDLSEAILTKLEGVAVSNVLPEYILKLADLFWSYTPKEDDSYFSSHIEVEHHFGLEHNYSNYHPASAYQTPVYWLLQCDPKRTIEFILSFTNKSVQSYANSNFDSSVQKVTVVIDDNDKQAQYTSHCLWNMYRGTCSPVSPYLLQSIHMALEKYFLEIGKDIKSEILEDWLIYLLKHSKSASISSVVTSIVLAYPDKTFNVAKILFKTKEFILEDTSRLVSDQGAKSLYSIGRNMGGMINEIYDDERIKTCDDQHRRWTLESLFLNYQCFRSEAVSESESEKRQKSLWEILDNYYKELPPESKQTNIDQTWRMFLARMDKRKMNITTEETDGGLAIQFNPELEPNLKEFSEASLAESSKLTKYSPLKIWADYKFNSNEKYKQYLQYENSPKLALKEAKEIVDKLMAFRNPEYLNLHQDESASFFLFNKSTPVYVCSVVLRDHIKELTDVEKSFCRDIILGVSSSILAPNYQHQISDGLHQAISVLPILITIFPEDKEDVKQYLLLSLLNNSHFDSETSLIMTIQKLWKNNFDDAQSLLLGYLLLKPKYENLGKVIREENYEKGVYTHQGDQLLERFIEENRDELQCVVKNKLTLSNLNNIEEYELRILGVAFRMIYQKTNDDNHKAIAKIIISSFAEKLLSDNREDKVDYRVRHDFLQTYTYFVLNSPRDEIQAYLNPFIAEFNSSESIADLFQEFVMAEDSLNTYDNFWLVWDSFKGKILDLCKDGDQRWYTDKIVKSYLFSTVRWKKTTSEWRSLRTKDNKFFKELSEKIGHCPSVLYAISKLLDNIGAEYIDDGVIWISNILRNNKELVNEDLEDDSIYYIEKMARKYIYENKEGIKKTKATKENILIILNFLVQKGSVVGYMLRESII